MGPSMGVVSLRLLSALGLFAWMLASVGALAAKTVPIVFTEDSEFRLVAGTSTQPNALNNDLGGPDGGTNSVETWEDLGAMSTTFAPADLLPTPEPDTGTLFGLGLIGLAAAKRRRRA